MKLKSREKILFVLACIAISVFIFDRIYYTPQSRKISSLRAEIKSTDLKLQELNLILKGVEAAESEILRLEKELKGLNERILRGEEFRFFLRHLAKESNSPQMKIISITPQEERIPVPEGKKGSPPFEFRKVSVQMVFNATFTKLGTYLRGMEELPFIIHIENLQVERNEGLQPYLKVTMGVMMYVTSS